MSRISLGHYWRLLFHIGTGGHHRFLVGRQILLQCLQPDTPVDPPRAVGLVSSPCMHLCQTSLSYGLFQSYPLSHNPLYLLRSSLLFHALPNSNSVFQYCTVTNYYLFLVFKVPRLAVLRLIYLKRGRIPVLFHNRLFKLYLITRRFHSFYRTRMLLQMLQYHGYYHICNERVKCYLFYYYFNYNQYCLHCQIIWYY